MKNNFDAPKMAANGYLISPHDAQVLRSQCGEKSRNWEARWTLAGFYYAHQLCCPQNRSCRIDNIVWIIDNAPEILRSTRIFLFAGPGDRPHVPQIQEAWQRRIDAAPDSPVAYRQMGDFLQAINPGEACSYYEKALSLGGDKAIESSLVTAKLLDKHGADTTKEDYGEHMTCFFDVLKAGDRLLQETRDRMQPTEVDWNRFFDIVHPLIWNPMLKGFAQTASLEPSDAPASTMCKSALRQVYKTFDAKSEVGRALMKPPLKALWDDLIGP